MENNINNNSRIGEESSSPSFSLDKWAKEETSKQLSPFMYYPEKTTYYLNNSIKYAGKKFLEHEYLNGSLGKRECLILRLLSECGTMTAHLISEAFDNQNIPFSYKKLAASNKDDDEISSENDTHSNPYRKELNYLVKNGMITTGKVYYNFRERMKTYHITPSAKDWILSMPSSVDSLYNTFSLDDCIPAIDALGVLNHLSMLNFHIRFVKGLEESLNEWQISNCDISTQPYDAKYVMNDGTNLLAVSVRNIELNFDKALRLAKGFFVSADRFIFIVDSKETMLSLRNHLLSDLKNIDSKALYLTDSLIHSEEELRFYKINNNMIETHIFSENA